MSDRVADKLREARALIAKGWTQRSWAQGGCVCSLGALNEAFTGDPTNIDMSYAAIDAEKALSAAVGTMHIVEWNDTPGRTQAEVVAAFDRAIEFAEKSA